MPALNRVMLIGRLGRDPEARYTPNGTRVCTFSLAVDRTWRDRDGELHREADWFQVETWGRLAEICEQYLSKGRLVYVEGRLQTRRYEHEGETRYYTRVVASQMQMLDRRPEEPEPVEEEAEGQEAPEAA